MPLVYPPKIAQMHATSCIRANQLVVVKGVLLALALLVGFHIFFQLAPDLHSSSPYHHPSQHASHPSQHDSNPSQQHDAAPPEDDDVLSDGTLRSYNPGAKAPAGFRFEVTPTDRNKGIKGAEFPDLEDYKVRGNSLSKFLDTPPLYPLLPFPHSPVPPGREEELGIQHHHPWLAAVIVSAFDPGRRTLMRNTWMATYRDSPVDMKFVIGNPGPLWSEVIQRENRTYGDLIILEHIQEDDFTANTVKTIELYRYLSSARNPRKYAVVSKVDTDMWLNIPAYFERKVRPLLAPDGAGIELGANATVIGQFYWDAGLRLALPHGAVYTMTWDLVELLPKLRWKYGVVRNEDMMVSWLLGLAKQRVNFLGLTQAEKFDFLRKDAVPGTAWARTKAGVDRQFHAVWGKDVLAVHLMKTAEDWLLVAQCFDEKGIKEMPPVPEGEDEGEKAKDEDYRTPWFKNIPKEFWEEDKDGNTVMSGVYTLEKGLGPYFERIGD